LDDKAGITATENGFEEIDDIAFFDFLDKFLLFILTAS
jgi:hypothetical protein